MSDLVRVVAPPHDGLIVCRDHLRQITDGAPKVAEVPADQIEFWGYQCLMCGVDPVPGRLCENEDCRKPLHPQWPAVYCSDACALEDV